MAKRDNVISCELSDEEKNLLLEYISISNFLENRLYNYIENIKNDSEYLNKCYMGEQLREELNEKVGYEYYVFDMYRLLLQLDNYVKNNALGNEIGVILNEYKEEELTRNSFIYKNEGSFSAIILSRRGIVIQ